MTICPCCGFKFEGTLREGCVACGVIPVGEALPKPEHELPAYGRSLLLSITGSLMVLVFVVQTILALLKNAPGSGFLSWIVSLGFWSWIAAAETAAWRLKWIAIPATIVVLWGSRRVYRSMLQTPSRFCGLRYARGGLLGSALVPLLIVVLIGVTVPERLRHRQWANEARIKAVGLAYDRAFFQYQMRYGKLPNYLNDLKLLPDPDGSIAAALNSFDPKDFSSAYKPSGADVASKQKPRTLRGTVIRNASLSTSPDEPLSQGVSFTNYELLLPGEDKILGTDDDWIVRDGIVKRASEFPRKSGPAITTSTAIVKP